MYRPIKDTFQLATPETSEPRTNTVTAGNTTVDDIVYALHLMSKTRLVLFIITIFMCFAIVIVVLFVIPCEWSGCIKSTKLKEGQPLWTESVFTDIELKGKPSAIVLDKKIKRLVFIVQGSILNSQTVPPRTERFPSGGGGLLQLDTLTGKEMWRKRLDPLPDKVDCTLLNEYHTEDSDVFCIVGATVGNLLGVVSSGLHKGELIWKHTKGQMETNTTKFYSKKDIVYLEFPVIVPDCNKDGVNEMALFQHINEIPTLLIVSGKNGRPMINNFNNDNCTKMTDLVLGHDMSLVFICHKSVGTDSIENLPLKEMLNCTPDWVPEDTDQFPKHHHAPIDENQYTMIAGHFRLNIINSHYDCPTQCKVIMNVTNSTGDAVWSKHYNNSFAMRPVSFELRNNISGFVIKLWIWTSEKNDNEHYVNAEKIVHIEEKTVLIFYNCTRDVHVKDLSTKKILQVCEKDSNCQPKLEYQKHSMELMDIDNKGYQELVTVMSTFQLDNTPSQFTVKDKRVLQLVSKVNVFPLEASLVQHYETGDYL